VVNIPWPWPETVHSNTYWNNFAVLVAHCDRYFDVLVGHFAASAAPQLSLHQRDVDVVAHITCQQANNYHRTQHEVTLPTFSHISRQRFTLCWTILYLPTSSTLS